MKKIIALIAVSILSLGIFAGCQKAATPAETPTETPAETPGEVSDGTLLLAEAQTAENSGRFPYVWVNRGGIVNLMMYRSLFLADPTLTKVEPDLAESFKLSDDGLTLTVVMKDGLKWSDGEALTAEDVKFSIATNLKASQSSGIYTNAFSNIKGAKAWKEGAADLEGVKVDGKTITITLDAVTGNLVNVLGQFVILPKHKLENANPLEIHNDAFWKSPVTSGMYKVGEIVENNYYTLVPSENYEGTAPKIQKIQVNFINDLVAAAQAGKSDFISTNVSGQISEYNKIASFKQYPVDILFYRYLVANIKDTEGKVNEKIADKRVREAILYAVDRKTLAESLYPELAALSNTGVPSGLDTYLKGAEDYAYNPEKAKELLKEAGFDFNQTLKIRYYYNDQTSIDFMDAVAFYLNEVGIKTDVMAFQNDATTELYKTKDYDFALKGLSAFGYEEWYGEYKSTQANFKNILGGDTTFDELINKLVATADPAERASILQDLQKLEQENLFKIPFFNLKQMIYVNTDKVVIPAGVEFGNPWYNYDMQFENWTVK